MDTLTFLQRVLPVEGYYVATVLNPGSPPSQGYFTSIADLEKSVAGANRRGDNVYYAISTFVEKGNRKQNNVHHTKVIALDVDCGEGKPFDNWKSGLVALSKFVSELRLPKPMIVHSGNGLHVYWILDYAAAPAQWVPLAQAMKDACAALSFRVDPAVPADSARVLRPVGTTNVKGGRPVKLLIDAPDTTVEVLWACLSAYGSYVQPEQEKPAARRSGLAEALVVHSDLPPAIAEVVASKCQQIGWAVRHQSEVSEPVWYNLIGVAAYCENPDDVAVAWSENHPDYDYRTTIRKLNQWRSSTTGPTTCAKFESDRPTGCAGCKFKDKIGTPARLGVQYQTVAPPQEVPDAVAHEIPMPRGFKRTASGIKLTIDESDVDVCPFDIYPVAYGRDEGLGYETVRYHWNRPHVGWRELTMRQAYLTDGSREFPTSIADQGIVLTSKRQTEYFQLMLRSYMEELRQKRAMTNLYGSMGWKENFSQFVIGDTLLRRNADGTVTSESCSLSSGTTRMGNDLYGTAGTLPEAVAFTTLMDKAKLYPHMFSFGVGLSSILYAFTGLSGVTISLYGATGGGKTLAQLWMQSIWGDPNLLHFGAKFTQNALLSRMGLYCHLPMTIDEATIINNKDAGELIYMVSQGRDKARLTRSAEEREAKTWAMPMVVSTNLSLSSKLSSAGLDTDAQLARLLEFEMASNPLFTGGSEGGKKIYEFVTSHYGVLGRAFATKVLELGNDGVRAAIAEHTAVFQRKYRTAFTGEERFWEQAIILQDLASSWAKGWGLIAYDHEAATKWALGQIGAIRKSVAENKTDAFDLIAEYLNDTASAAVTVAHTGAQKPVVDYSRMPKADIRIRFDVYRKTSTDAFSHGTMLIDRTHFRKWLSVRGGDYKALTGALDAEGVVATPKSQKAFLGKDTPVKTGQNYVLGVNLNHPRLYGILDDADQAYEDMMLGQIKVVD